MSNAGEFPQFDARTAQMVDDLELAHNVNNVPFSSVTISGEPMVSDVFDPNVLALRTHAVVHWPGDKTPAGPGARYEIFALRPADEMDGQPLTIQRIRQLVTRATISDETIQSMSARVRTVQRQIDSMPHPQGVNMVARMCRMANTPLGLLHISMVGRSAIIKPGTRVARLWYPPAISPRAILAEMQNIVGQA